MLKQTGSSNTLYSALPTEVDGFNELAELALDLRWSWDHAADDIWRQLDPELWALTRNPWGGLQTVARDQIKTVMADPAFRKRVDGLVKIKRQAAQTPAWFQQTHDQTALNSVAYFSM